MLEISFCNFAGRLPILRKGGKRRVKKRGRDLSTNCLTPLAIDSFYQGPFRSPVDVLKAYAYEQIERKKRKEP